MAGSREEDGPVVIVTGASSGLGRGTALRLSRDGQCASATSGGSTGTGESLPADQLADLIA